MVMLHFSATALPLIDSMQSPILRTSIIYALCVCRTMPSRTFTSMAAAVRAKCRR